MNTAFRKTAETFTPGAQTLEQHFFTSPEVFALERERIFSRQWICAGHESQIRETGDFITADVLGESLIIVRDNGGEVRACYNVCRHRGARMCEEASGHFGSGIQCPYHAWTYSLNGRLIGVPRMEEFPEFNRADFPLHAAPCGVWEGFIFVNLAENPHPLAQWFAPIDGKFGDWKMPSLRSAKRVEYDVRANWKLIFQNYSECYHCPLVHPELCQLSPADSSENDLTEGPFLGGFMKINDGKSLTKSGHACTRPIVKADGSGQQRVFYYSIFPNILLSTHPDYVMIHQLWPKAQDRTQILCDWFFHPDAFKEPGFDPNDAIDFWDLTNRQDWKVCELSQAGISSRAYRPGPYSPRESIPAAWDREYLRALGEVTFPRSY